MAGIVYSVPLDLCVIINLRDVEIIFLKLWIVGEELDKKIVAVSSCLVIISDIIDMRIGGVGETNSSRALHYKFNGIHSQ